MIQWVIVIILGLFIGFGSWEYDTINLIILLAVPGAIICYWSIPVGSVILGLAIWSAVVMYLCGYIDTIITSVAAYIIMENIMI